ncbi:TatD family hydrolase [bacterium]|nr:TatD family hydrolase [candidate division CSSED10-310 bacterium]
MNELTDTHVHLTDPPYEAAVDEVIQKADRAGVTTLIVPGYDTESNRKIVNLKQRFPGILTAAGFHPMFLDPEIRIIDQLESIRDAIPLVAIGEIGIDSRKNAPPLEAQEDAFREQLYLSVEWGLPVLIHCVHAHSRCLSVLQNVCMEASIGNRVLRGVIHRASCSVEIAASYVELGFYFGLGPDIFDTRRTRLRTLAQWIPSDRILLETDAPYARKPDLSICDPWTLPMVVQHLSELRGEPVDQLIEAVSQNTSDLFGV